MFEKGEIVNIAYTGYTVQATILEEQPNGWYLVEQITDYEDRPQGERPRYQAAEEYISKLGEPRKPGPFTLLWAETIKLHYGE